MYFQMHNNFSEMYFFFFNFLYFKALILKCFAYLWEIKNAQCVFMRSLFIGSTVFLKTTAVCNGRYFSKGKICILF